LIGKLFIQARPAFLLLTGIIFILVIISGFLYQQKKFYQQQNRELIIQNDSVLSVNIELQNALKQQPSAIKKK
jgi:CHASE3 domain sensor protein